MDKNKGKIVKNGYPRVSNTLVAGTVITYIAFLLLLTAFFAPYWIKSYENSWSEFSNMGLWEYCFRDYMHPYYLDPQFFLFIGCRNIFSDEYNEFRAYLLPGWLIVVQICATIAFIIIFICLGFISFAVVKFPLEYLLTFEWVLVKLSWIGITCSAFLLFVAVSVFGGNAYRQDWLITPTFNKLSWSYTLTVISCILLTLSANIFYKESKLHIYRRKEKHLVKQIKKKGHGFHSDDPGPIYIN